MNNKFTTRRDFIRLTGMGSLGTMGCRRNASQSGNRCSKFRAGNENQEDRCGLRPEIPGKEPAADVGEALYRQRNYGRRRNILEH